VTNRLITIAASGLAAAAVSVGVAVANDDPYPAAAPPPPTPESGAGQPPAPAPASEDMVASRLAQSAYMTGKAVIDGQGDDAGDSRGKGSATFLQVDGRTVCYGFTVTSTGTPTAIAIYKGAAGQNGPPVVPFTNVPKDANGQPAGDPGWSSGCKAVQDPNEVAALRRIRANPQNYYLLMKTQDFPNGAVRGQLSKLLYDNKP
jgi:hypothetical protein